MKQNIEIDIPEGYEVSHSDMVSAWDDSTKSGNNIVMTYLKKKQTKNFDWYIDEYLREDPFTTKENLSNHLFTEDIKEIKTKLRSGDYRLVPWEIKIGLFRFILESEGLSNIYYFLYEYNKSRLAGCSVQYDGLRINHIFPSGFISDIIKTKTN